MNLDDLMKKFNTFTIEELQEEIQKSENIITEHKNKIMISQAVLQTKGGITKQTNKQPCMQDIKEALIEIITVQERRIKRLVPVFNYLREKGFSVDIALANRTRQDLINEGFLTVDKDDILKINN